MKEGWEIYTLGELCEMRRGLTYAKGDEAEYSKNIVLRSNNVDLETKTLDFTELKYLKDDFIIPEDKKVKKGSFLICMSNGSKKHLGKVALIDNDYDYAFGGFMGLLVPDNSIVNSKYLWTVLSTKRYADFIKSLSDGAGINNLKYKDIAVFNVPVPPLSEQERIVAFLNAEFEKIDQLKANAATQLQAAKDLFQAALKEMLTPKDGWNSKSIGEICEIKGGKRVPKGYKLKDIPTDYIYIRVADFNDNGTIDINDLKYIDQKVYEQIKRYTITDQDVYISIAGTIGKAGIIPSELNGANLTENACKLVLNGLVDKEYIYYYTLLPSFKKQLEKLTKTGSQPKLAITRLATANISYPNMDNQTKIVNTLKNTSNVVKQLQSNYDQTLTLCNDLKQALLKSIFE